jgi:DNA-binding CsgD family transcriptional regulator
MPAQNRNWVYDQISTLDAEVAARCALDWTLAEIAEDLDMHESTVKDHVVTIRSIIGGEKKRDVAHWWRENKDAYMARIRERLLLDDAG